MHDLLRSTIREFLEEIEEEELDEFSGVAAIGGGPATPLGTDAYYPDSRVGRGKKRKVDEANTTYGLSLVTAIDLNGDGVIDRSESSLFGGRVEMYQSSVEKLARSYGGAESPFKNKRQVEKFLARKI